MSNFRLPAEWEPQSAVWLAWPCNANTWQGNLERVKNRLAALAGLISTATKVNLICPVKHQNEAEKFIFKGCALLNNIEYFDIETDDVWCRDFGPLITVSQTGDKLLTDWVFNAWGGKHPYSRDNEVNAVISKKLTLNRLTSSLILEGGAIDVNGCGLLMTTEEVLLNPNRNSHISKQDYEKSFLKLGVTQTVWLKQGLLNDDTDGHIDNLARFVSKDTVLLASCSSDNPNYSRLAENREILKNTIFNGSPLEIIDMPLPSTVIHDKQDLPASYLNFLITNNLIIVPSYGQKKNDKKAQDTLKACFPNHKIKGFDCSDFLQEGGAVHCLTMNQP